MENLKLKQLAVGEFKVESVTDFCLNSFENSLVIYGNGSEFDILELLYKVDMLITLPYRVKLGQIPCNKPLLEIVKPIDLENIYSNCGVLESQELALDPLYVAECSLEAPKPRLLQAELVTSSHNSQLCCVLTTYGACDLLQQDMLSKEWKLLNTNLSKILQTDIFPNQISPTSIQTYTELRDFIDIFVITCFVWSQLAEYHVIYLGTAAGYVVALKFLEDTMKFVELFSLKTSIGRISYMTTCDNLMLVAGIQGQIRLLKIDPPKMKLREMDYLWSKKDRMACRKAIISYSIKLQSYLIVFCKAAHVLAYRLDLEGCIMSNATEYVGGIKITGLESIAEHDFIVSTITCTVKYIRISCPSAEELTIETQPIEHDMDSTNLQILGLGSSKSRNLWSFLLSRNKSYTHQSKYNQNTAFLNVCKISSHDNLTKLINLNLTSMDMARDLVMAINLDIVNSFDAERYSDFLNLNRLNCPKALNEAYLQKLQIKLIIVRNFFRYQKMRYKNLKRNIEAELHFLESIVQLVYILGRLQYLQTIRSPEKQLSSFQQLSVACMQSQLTHLLNGLAVTTENEENPLRNSMEQFSKVISEEYEKCKFNTDSFRYKPEQCLTCNQDICITTFDKCREDHAVKRCTISYLQLPMFQSTYCPHCYACAVTNDNNVDLRELFPTNEFVKCTFCRFLLKEDTF